MNDKTIRQNIIDELEWEPSIDSTHIGVVVDDGVVTLSGHVPGYAQKAAVEKAVKRVRGVRAIAEELKVQLEGANPYADEDIARRALTLLDLNVLVPSNAIAVKVQQGWLTLTGEVQWDYQRTAAIDDLRKLRGVMGITNLITLKARLDAGDVKRRIEQALERHAEFEAKDIHVAVHGGKVTLEGTIDTLAERHAVESAVWTAPGVQTIEDHMRVA